MMAKTQTVVNTYTGVLRLLFVVIILSLSACVSTPPKHIDNICHIFDEKSRWYKKAKRTEKRWGVPMSVSMAFIYQESRFVAKAKPPRTKILGFIPGPRKSSAYGYSQAKNTTWNWYKKATNSGGADRNDFDDAINFIAWYNQVSSKRLGMAKHDAYRLYLAYHEGQGGYERGTYKKKSWLIAVAKKVSQRSKKYTTQLAKCEDRLNSSGWWPF